MALSADRSNQWWRQLSGCLAGISVGLVDSVDDRRVCVRQERPVGNRSNLSLVCRRARGMDGRLGSALRRGDCVLLLGGCGLVPSILLRVACGRAGPSRSGGFLGVLRRQRFVLFHPRPGPGASRRRGVVRRPRHRARGDGPYSSLGRHGRYPGREGCDPAGCGRRARVPVPAGLERVGRCQHLDSSPDSERVGYRGGLGSDSHLRDLHAGARGRSFERFPDRLRQQCHVAAGRDHGFVHGLRFESRRRRGDCRSR